jgi:acetyl esterase/lipase
MASDYTASHLAIYIINCEIDLLRSSGEGYTAQRTASGVKVKVERIEGAQHGSLNLPLIPNRVPAYNFVGRFGHLDGIQDCMPERDLVLGHKEHRV